MATDPETLLPYPPGQGSVLETEDDMLSITEIQAKVKAYRQAHGLTQERLAQQLGLTTSTIVRLEQGAYKRGPSPLLREKLARVGITHTQSSAQGVDAATPPDVQRL